MSRPIAVLRPEPGNQVTAIAIEAQGRKPLRLPLFATTPLAWEVPDIAAYDALIVTSANAIRHGGPGLRALLELPVYAVGDVTAEAAARAGFHVAETGKAGAEELLRRAEAAGVRHALHIAGRDRTIEPGGLVADILTVYVSEALEIGAKDAVRLAGSVALVKSARAGARLAEIVDAHSVDRAGIALVAISERAAAAAGTGWEQLTIPRDISAHGLIHAAMALAD
jgi:uroporphyrinogen-III synthase